MDIDQPGREHLTEIVPAQKGTLDGASILSGRILAQYLVDVMTEIEVFDLTGESLGKVELPGFGSIDGFSGDQDDTETFYVYTSYNTPARIYRYDVTANESQLIREPSVEVRSGEVRSRASVLQQQGRHAHPDDAGVSQALRFIRASRVVPEPGDPAPDASLRLRRLQHFAHAGLQPRLHRLDGDGRRRGRGEPARRRRIRRGVAPGRQDAQEAKRVRRFHCRRRVAHRRGLYDERKAQHYGRQQRRTSGRRR